MAVFEREAGAALLPHCPAFLQRRAVARVAATLRGFLPGVGVRAAQLPLLEAWTRRMLDLLELHFAAHDFLFGGRPSIGDFSLVGSMYGHLGRDPWPARELIAPRPHLRAWIARMAEPTLRCSGDWLAGDRIAATLEPVLRTIFSEFLPMLEGINRQVKAAIPALAEGKSLPRSLADVEILMGEGIFRRAALPYSLWMAQRSLDFYRALAPDEQQQVRDWLASVGGLGFLDLDLPRLRRKGLRVMPL